MPARAILEQVQFCRILCCVAAQYLLAFCRFFSSAPGIATISPDGALEGTHFFPPHVQFNHSFPGTSGFDAGVTRGMDLASTLPRMNQSQNPHRLSVPTPLEYSRGRSGSDPGNLFTRSNSFGGGVPGGFLAPSGSQNDMPLQRHTISGSVPSSNVSALLWCIGTQNFIFYDHTY